MSRNTIYVSESKTSATHNLGMMRRWAVCFTLRPRCLKCSHWWGRWVRPRACLDVVARESIAAPATLSEATSFTHWASLNNRLFTDIGQVREVGTHHDLNYFSLRYIRLWNIQWNSLCTALVWIVFLLTAKNKADLAICFMLVSCLAYSSTWKTETTCSSETSINSRRTGRCYISEDRIFQTTESFN
jgi:hypothetical protein